MLSRTFIQSTASALLVAMGSFAFAQTVSPTKPEKPVIAAWTELVGDDHAAPDPQPTGHTVLRIITSAPTCPPAMADGHPLRLSVRQGPSAAFPVTTCQATPQAAAQHITVAGIALATEPAHLQRIIVIGDTGCRLKGIEAQDCNDVRRWPFPLVAAHAAARHPDLVIHVGDYYYRETSCPTAESGCAGSPHGDQWASWDADLFSPVAPLLTAAPWIFVRGNHEQCGRGAVAGSASSTQPPHRSAARIASPPSRSPSALMASPSTSWIQPTPTTSMPQQTLSPSGRSSSMN